MKSRVQSTYFLFALITSLIGLNWFMWGPLLSSVIEPRYKISGFAMALFISSVPLALVFLSYFTGSFADKDPKRTTIIAAIILGVTTLIRPFMIASFPALLIMQLIFTISAAFCFTSWSPFTYRLFEQKEASSKIATFTAFLTGGQILAFLITYPLADKIGLFSLLLIYGIISAIVAVFYILSVSKLEFPYKITGSKKPTFSEGAKIILSEPSMKSLSLISLLDIGVFAWLAGWYPKMLTSFKGASPSEAATVNSMILLGCLIGAMTVPNLSHRLKKVKVFFLLLPIICIAMFSLVPVLHSFGALLIDGAILGFALFPMYPLGVHLPSAYSKIGIKYAGVGSGIILIAANIGGFMLPELGAAVSQIIPSITIFGIIPMALMFITGLFFKDPDTYA
jgi:MFS family permease